MTTAEVQRGTSPIAAPRRARIPGARVRPDGPSPPHQPAAGHYLIAGIDAVLAGLAGSSAVVLADELRGALARTAACGDTCRVRQAADSVRQAAELLRAGSAEDAELLLRGARASLMDRPMFASPR
jgi:hypothetical protein